MLHAVNLTNQFQEKDANVAAEMVWDEAEQYEIYNDRNADESE